MTNRYFVENAANGVLGDVIEATSPENALEVYAANCIGYTTPEMLVQSGYVVRAYISLYGKSMTGADRCRMGDIVYPPDQKMKLKTMSADLAYIADRLQYLNGVSSLEEAAAVAKLAKELAAEQGVTEGDLIDWLSNRTYEWTELLAAAQGDAATLARVRAEAGLPVFS